MIHFWVVEMMGEMMFAQFHPKACLWGPGVKAPMGPFVNSVHKNKASRKEKSQRPRITEEAGHNECGHTYG